MFKIQNTVKLNSPTKEYSTYTVTSILSLPTQLPPSLLDTACLTATVSPKEPDVSPAWDVFEKQNES